MIYIKVCGITNKEDALKAAELKVNALGFIFAQSPRKIKPNEAKKIIKELPLFIFSVGVFVNEKIDVVEKIIDTCSLNILQFHGQENPSYCSYFKKKFKQQKIIKVFSIEDKNSLNNISLYSGKIDAILLDTFIQGKSGGTGKTFDWNIALLAKKYGQIILSGGLNSDNIKTAIKKVSPYAIDVNSGIEKSPGIKDHQKMEKFIKKIICQQSTIC